MKIQQSYQVIDNEWITLSDGVRLAAKIWLPDVSIIDPVPAVFEFLPYGKRYYTHLRDESNYPMFASAGIAGVRVDLRGCGESEGVMDGEYTEQEINDACEVIEWISKQRWCNGSVGMMGISWGGHNSLQVAAVRPPALKAIISVCATTDRYNDYIHYKNGCHLHTSLYWSNTMLVYQGRAPDPALVGAEWHDMRMQRLQNAQSFLEDWLSHPRRDDYWSSGQLSDIQIPVLIVSGWADGNRNTALRAAEQLNNESKIVVGPWIHKYPQMAYPKPRWEFRDEAIRWWNRWLRNDFNNVESIPRVRAFIFNSPRPTAERHSDPGKWVSKSEWKTPKFEEFYISHKGILNMGRNNPSFKKDLSIFVKTSLDLGSTSGEYFTLKPDAEMAGDQRFDDALSVCFDSKSLKTAQEYLGYPIFEAEVSCEKETAHLVVRIVDVHPDGVSTRVSFGFINLAHRDENASSPKPMPKNEKVRIKIVLDSCGYRFEAGHKIRIALSTSYWPYIFPSASNPGVTIDQSSIRLKLPILENYEEVEMPEPKVQAPLQLQKIDNEKLRMSQQIENELKENQTFETTRMSKKIDKDDSKENQAVGFTNFYEEAPKLLGRRNILHEINGINTRRRFLKPATCVDFQDGLALDENKKRASISEELSGLIFGRGSNLVEMNEIANKLIVERIQANTRKLIAKDIEEAKTNEKSSTKVERYINRDLMSRRTHYHVHEDYGLKQVPSTDGLYIHCIRDEKWSVIPDEPLSCHGLVTCSVKMLRADDRFGVFHSTTIAKSELIATKENWILKANLEAFEGEMKIFEKEFEKVIIRDFM